MQKFLEKYHQYIEQKDILILGVSGGVDSMVLLHLILEVHPSTNIVVAHFDHGLRGAESDGDREFVLGYCSRHGVRCEIEKMDIGTLAKSQKKSIESMAREKRYDFIAKICNKYSGKYILTAHHLDDRIETALFNGIRGTKFGGIHSIEELQNFTSVQNISVRSVCLFRPLLEVPKSEIISYATEHNISYREDSSNTDTEYLRNHIRRNILPEFSVINPEYRKAILGFIKYTSEVTLFIDTHIQKWFIEESEIVSDTIKYTFSTKRFETESLFFQKEIIRYLYEKANIGTIGLSEGAIDEILRFILTAHGGTEKIMGKLHLSKNKHIISTRFF